MVEASASLSLGSDLTSPLGLLHKHLSILSLQIMNQLSIFHNTGMATNMIDYSEKIQIKPLIIHFLFFHFVCHM